jgi:hypothetical protein
MTQVLLAAVIVLGIAVAVDLALTFAVIRRLAAVESSAGPAEPVKSPYPDKGFRVADFTARTLDGQDIDSSVLDDTFGTAMFLLPHCGPCGRLIDSIQDGIEPVGAPVLAFIVGSPESADVLEVAAKLPPGIQIAAVTDQGAITQAFGVGGSYPVMLRLEDRVVLSAGTAYQKLPAKAAAGLPQ